LTPASGDKGRDVIATKRGICSLRVLDQAKAYAPRHLVRHNDVRAMLGVLSVDQNASKGLITTTSDFEPGILSSGEFASFIPYRLELKNGEQLLKWLAKIQKERFSKKNAVPR
jgi:restriction system protein